MQASKATANTAGVRTGGSPKCATKVPQPSGDMTNIRRRRSVACKNVPQVSDNKGTGNSSSNGGCLFGAAMTSTDSDVLHRLEDLERQGQRIVGML
eukprot:5863128-Prymnesium_polylepis.1